MQRNQCSTGKRFWYHMDLGPVPAAQMGALISTMWQVIIAHNKQYIRTSRHEQNGSETPLPTRPNQMKRVAQNPPYGVMVCWGSLPGSSSSSHTGLPSFLPRMSQSALKTREAAANTANTAWQHHVGSS